MRKSGGARRDRTADLLRAKQALSQLSYGPLTCPLSAWRRWLLAHSVMYQNAHSLIRSQSALPIEKSPASAMLLASRVGLFAPASEQTIFWIPRRRDAKHSLLCEQRCNAGIRKMVGLGRFELPTSPLSGVRSNQLSYRPSQKTSGRGRLQYDR